MIGITGGPGNAIGCGFNRDSSASILDEIGMSEYGRISLGEQLTCRRLGG